MQGFKEFTDNPSREGCHNFRGLMAEELKAAPQDDNALKATATPEGEADENAEGEAAPRFNKKKIAIFVLLPLLVLLSGAGAAWKLGYLDGYLGHKQLDCAGVQESDADYTACAEQLAREANTTAPGVFVAIPDMIVNLNSTAKQPRFLKVALKVELEDSKAEKSFETVMPRIIDQFQAYLRELRLEDLRGSSGMYRMKIELLSRVRAAAPEIRVRDVLFQEILVQ